LLAMIQVLPLLFIQLPLIADYVLCSSSQFPWACLTADYVWCSSSHFPWGCLAADNLCIGLEGSGGDR